MMNDRQEVKQMNEITTQNRRIDFLVEAFKAESEEFAKLQTPRDTEGKRRLLRSLMNIRMPGSIPEEVLRIQDEYLTDRAKEKGIVWLSDIPAIKDGLSIWQGDITCLGCDAIVNAANTQMLGCFIPMHTCIDNCIHTYAGVQMRAECASQMAALREKNGENYEQPVGVPLITDAYNLPCKKVIHVAGPIVQHELTPALEHDLADCYANSLELCLLNGLKSAAFCCISTGLFRFPNRRAAEIAVQTVTNWLNIHPGSMERIIFNVFKDQDRRIYEELLS